MMGSPHQSRRLTEKDWSFHESVIRALFVEDGLPLRDVKPFMRTHHDFTATDRQWKHRIKKWKLDRNIKDHEMKTLVRKRQHRIISEPFRPRLKFRVRKFNVDQKKILRWMKENSVADDQLYNDGSGARTQSDISCYTASREGSPSLTSDVGWRTSAPTLQTSPSPPIASRDSSTVGSASSTMRNLPRPGCRVETINMSWAFDTHYPNLVSGHKRDQEGYPLTALYQSLDCEAHDKGWPETSDTLAGMLQGDGNNNVRDGTEVVEMHEDGRPRKYEWAVRIERKILGGSVLLTWAHIERELPSGRRSWLDLRLRTGLGYGYYREGSAEYRIASEALRSEGFVEAIADDNEVELQRMLTNGETTVVSLDAEGCYPISDSAYGGKVELTRLLLEHGSPLNFEHGSSKSFIWEIWEGFVSRSADHSDLSFAEEFLKCKDLMTLAFKYGARLDECVELGRNRENILFSINLSWGWGPDQYREVLQYLVELGADKEGRNCSGQTPLLHAIEQPKVNLGLITAYLAVNADVTATDKEGRDYLHVVMKQVLTWGPRYNSTWYEPHRKQLVALLQADQRFRDRAIMPDETPMLGELALHATAWNFWSTVVDDMGWDMTEMKWFVQQTRSTAARARPM